MDSFVFNQALRKPPPPPQVDNELILHKKGNGFEERRLYIYNLVYHFCKFVLYSSSSFNSSF